MPELPEVETVRRQLHAKLAHKTIVDVEIWRSGREQPLGLTFRQRVRGKTIGRIERRAKLLVWRFTAGDALIAHLKMTGRFVFVDAAYARQTHDRIRFLFDAAPSLVWADVRQFGFLRHVSASELEPMLSSYGPEPLELSIKELSLVFRGQSTRAIKSVLLDQTKMAGIGNIYADEACHRAGIRPSRRLASLVQQERVKLAQSIQDVLNESLAQKGTSANDYVDTDGERGGFLGLLRVYRRIGEPCVACGTPIQRIVLAQRGTYFCSKCQG